MVSSVEGPKRRSCNQASLCDWVDTCLDEKNIKSEQDNRLASQIDWPIACKLIEIRNAR